MFKSLTLFRMTDDLDLQTIQEALAAEAFTPCGPTQQKSTGWMPPRGADHGALVESVDGQWIARFMLETKAVPGDALRRRVDELAAKIEADTGRVPGKRERKDLRDDALQELLPHAFARQAAIWVWIDPETHLLAIDSSSMARLDEVTSSLIRTLCRATLLDWAQEHDEPLQPIPLIQLIQTKSTPQSVMTAWLAGEDAALMPSEFDLGRATTLVANGEQPARVKFDKHDLRTDEVRQHVVDGKLPVNLSLSWEDRVSFTLTQHLQIKSIGFDAGILDGAGHDEDRFDADMTICTAELRQMVTNLIKACGGEQEVTR